MTALIASVRRTAWMQLALGAIVGAGLAATTEPGRGWRFPLLAFVAVMATAALVHLRRQWSEDDRRRLLQAITLQFVGWAVGGFVLAELRAIWR